MRTIPQQIRYQTRLTRAAEAPAQSIPVEVELLSDRQAATKPATFIRKIASSFQLTKCIETLTVIALWPLFFICGAGWLPRWLTPGFDPINPDFGHESLRDFIVLCLSGNIINILAFASALAVGIHLSRSLSKWLKKKFG